MRWLWFQIVMAGLAWQAVSFATKAQAVYVGPGVVCAPYVRVEWGHGLRVQAPFVDFYVPPRYVHPVAGERGLREQLAATADDLRESLERFDTGAQWQGYLMLSPGMALAEDRLEGAGPPDGGLEQAAERFNAAAGDEQFAKISRLPAFQATRELLGMYLKQHRTTALAPEELPRPAASD